MSDHIEHMSEIALNSSLEEEIDAEYTTSEDSFQPWLPHSEAAKREQEAIKRVLTRRAGATFFGDNCFISRDAKIFTATFQIGARSWIAAGSIIRGHVTIGSESSINPYTHIAGKVTIGNGVRIAGLVSVYGFNHGTSRTDIPIYKQRHTSLGITIGDGSWIGANAVIVDGVTLGDHCIVAAGAVVIKNAPEYSMVGGNPARIIRDRRS